MQNLYALLGVPPHADVDAIHRAYRAQARRLHPDAAGDEEAMRRLNEAWAVLRDPELRAEYDELLGMEAFEPAPAVYRSPWVRRAPVLVTLAVLLAIFIMTAYVAVPATPPGR